MSKLSIPIEARKLLFDQSERIRLLSEMVVKLAEMISAHSTIENPVKWAFKEVMNDRKKKTKRGNI